MKSNRKLIVALIAATGIGSAAFAQGPSPANVPAGPQARPASMRFDPAQRAERHLDFLKYQLKITDAQEPLWNVYADKVKSEAGKGFQSMREQMANPNLTAPERMAQMQQTMEARAAAMKDANESFGHLYAALTPEQKKLADKYVARFGKGPHEGMRHGRGMPPQGPQMPQG